MSAIFDISLILPGPTNPQQCLQQAQTTTNLSAWLFLLLPANMALRYFDPARYLNLILVRIARFFLYLLHRAISDPLVPYIVLTLTWFIALVLFLRQCLYGRNRVPPFRRHDGLSFFELGKLPKIRGRELVLASDCCICLSSIGTDEVVRLLPGCNHGFHSGCIDAWLSRRPLCPLCRSDVRLGWVTETFSDEECPI